MTAPRLESCYFAHQQIPHWSRMARVLEASARRHCPDWRIQVSALSPVDVVIGNGPRTFTSNTLKLEHWVQTIEAAQEGERILLIDVDTMILRPLDDIWEQDFDVAYTAAERFPMNGGVVFVKVSDRSKAFMAAWLEKDRELLHDTNPRPTWRNQFGGINQAAFCLLVNAGVGDVRLLPLPCATWNCEDSTWAKFDPSTTRILHVKSTLRQACVDPCPPEFGHEALVALWRAADREAGRVGC